MYWLKYKYIIISFSVIVDSKRLSIHNFMTVSSVNAYVEMGESTSSVKGLVFNPFNSRNFQKKLVALWIMKLGWHMIYPRSKETPLESLKRVLSLNVWAVFVGQLSWPDESGLNLTFRNDRKMFSHLYTIAFRKFVYNS